MLSRKLSNAPLLAALCLVGCASQTTDQLAGLPGPNATFNPTFKGAFVTTRSTPITVGFKPSFNSGVSPRAASETLLWAVNPDTDSVSIFDVSGDANTKLGEIPVGDNPQSVAVNGTGLTAYVVNQGSNSVSVISGEQRSVTTIPNVGPNPYGAALTPDGRFLYVTGASSGNLFKIDTASNQVIQTLDIEGQVGRPLDLRGVAVSEDAKTVFVTQLLAEVRAPGEGFDNGKQGVIYTINIGNGANDQLGPPIILPPLTDTGFTEDRTQFCDPNEATFCGGPTDPVGAFPNVIQSVTVAGNKLFIPSLGSSPEPPVRFNSNVQALFSCVDLANNNSVVTVNHNAAVRQEPVKAADPLNRVFFSTPWAIQPVGNNAGYVVAAGVDLLVKIDLQTLQPITRGDGSIVRIPVGKNPVGITFAPDSERAYVLNYITRNVSIINTESDSVIATMPSTASPLAGSPEATQLLGKELFNSALGPPADPNDASFTGRFTMSDNGWGSCFNCHPFGLSDGVTWIFPNGPRQTIPLDGTFSGNGDQEQRILNWTAVRSSVQDFEKNTENVSGGFGLIGPRGAADGVVDHGANRGKDARADAINEYVKTIRSPFGEGANSPAAAGGREIFIDQGCNACHGGAAWTTSRVNYTLPAGPATGVTLFDGQVVKANGFTMLHDVESYDPNSPIEVRGGGALVGRESQGAQGFNPPSLLGVQAHGPYFHDGRFASLSQVVDSGHGQQTPLDAGERGQLTSFLESIDDLTQPVPTPNPFLLVSNTVGQSVTLFAAAQNLQGNIPPTSEMAGPATTFNTPFHITGSGGLDPNDATFMANNQGQSLLRITPQGNGPVPPISVLQGPATQIQNPAGICYDRGRDILYNVNVGGGSSLNAFHQAKTRSGDTPPNRRVTGTPNLFALSLDSRADRLYASRPGPGQIAVFDQASTIDGPATPTRSFSAAGLNSPAGMFLDSARNRLYVASQNSSQIFIFSNPHKLSGSVTPSGVLGGSNTGFVFPRNVAVDVFRDQLYVLDFNANAVFVFNSASMVSGNVAPDRIIQGAATKLNGPGGLQLLFP